MRNYYFEKLEVWELGKQLTLKIYKLTTDFPGTEQFGLTSQLRRAAISITSNIAEGSSRQTGKDQARFSEIAFGSLMEVLNQSIIAKDLGFIPESDLNDLRPLIEEIGNKLNSLRKSQLSR
jgi:four helix bundle protein